MSQVPVTDACKPSFSVGRDQEYHQARQIVLETLALKTHHKNELVEWLKV
jgi:hypothetical protein